MATQDFKTSAAKAFREHYDKLVDSIQEADLPVLGARFFSRQIISRETMEMVENVSTSRALRVSKLMLAVMAHLDVHPDKFESALDVFREELVYTDFASLIASSIGKWIDILIVKDFVHKTLVDIEVALNLSLKLPITRKVEIP